MNSWILGFGGATQSAKRLFVLVLVSLALIVSLPVVAVGSMGASALTFLASTPNAEAAETKGFYMGGPIPGNTYAWGNCTYWSYAMRLWAGNPIPTTWGNANTWDDRARADGYVVNSIPAVGAIYQDDSGDYGHVAYVIAVDPISGDWTISEMNAPTLNVVTHRTFSKNSAGYYTFIHDKKGAPAWTPQPISNTLLRTGN